MQKYLRLVLVSALIAVSYACSGEKYQPAAGDIVFQDLASSQSEAIKLATGSKWTHCGIVFQLGGKYYVYEAVGPVKATDLKEWEDRGVGGHFTGAFRMFFIDVEGGQSTLLVTPAGETVLVDAGYGPRRGRAGS